MRFRTRLAALVALAVSVTVTLVTLAVSTLARRTFERLDEQRTATSMAQFRREFERSAEDVARRVESVSQEDIVTRIAVELSRPQPDYSTYLHEAGMLARSHGLELLELMDQDGRLISSAEWPARFGYKAATPGAGTARAFLTEKELPEQTVLALVAIREMSVGGKRLYITGGRSLGSSFLASLTLPPDLHVLLYSDFTSLVTPEGASPRLPELDPLIERVRSDGVEATDRIRSGDVDETVHAIPLFGRDGKMLAVFLVTSAHHELARLVRDIGLAGAVVGGIGVLLGALLSAWMAAWVTRPVERLAVGAREIGHGQWDAKVDISRKDEIGELADAFNKMTARLRDQRDRLVQAERVAAWRELARRLAHELKNPLFPLQITVENMRRAKESAPAEFDEVFDEGARTLLAELSDLKAVIARFSDFAKMPHPRPETTDLHELAGKTLKLFEAQMAGGRINAVTDFDPSLRTMRCDTGLIGRALQNLILNAIDAMPSGGTLTVRTRREGEVVRLDVADTGAGLSKEECARLFTPYYTSKPHGTGLGLAIVQSVVSDHGGRVSVESAPGAGTTFRIELPVQGPPQEGTAERNDSP
ncbi:MAG: ATP-binding protein [Acidobacteriota bacterium]